MKKVWSLLVILAILVGMFVCMGAQAFAAEGAKDLAVVAVAGDALSADQISMIKESLSDKEVLVVDVNGLDFEQSGDDYNYVYVDMDQGFTPSGYEFIWPGMGSVPTRDVTDAAGAQCKVVLLPIGPDDQVETINAAVDGYKQAGVCVVIAIAPESSYNVQAAVDSNVDKVLTCGETGVYADKLIKVGSDSSNPVSVISVNELGGMEVTSMPIPVAAVPDDNSGEETADGSGIADMLAPGLPVAGGESEGEGETGSQDPDPMMPAEPEQPAEPETYNVIYSANADPHTGIVADAYGVVSGTEYTLSDNGYARDGYAFSGWDVNGETKHPGDTITVNSNVTVNAIWSEITSSNDENARNGLGSFIMVAYVPGEGTGEKVDGFSGMTGSVTLPGCPEGWTFVGHAFAGWKVQAADGTVSGELLQAGSKYTVSGTTTFVAQWEASETTEPTQPGENEDGNDQYGDDQNGDGQTGGVPQIPMLPGPADPEVTAPATYSVTYKIGESTFTDETKYTEGAPVPVKSFEGFNTAAPDGQKFKAWSLNGAEYTETTYTMGTEDVVFEAVFEALPLENYPVHFNANGGSGTMADVAVGAGADYTLPKSGFTAPQGKYFSGWLIGQEIKQPGAAISVNAETTLTAQWADLQDAGHIDGMTWTPGDADLSVTYQAPIATVKIDNALLTSGVHYQLSADGKTATILSSYLASLTAGDHTVVFTFSNTQGDIALAAAYASESMVLTVKPAPQPTAEPNTTPAPNTTEVTWADRSQNLTIGDVNWPSKPVDLEIDYGASGFKPVDEADYSIGQNADGKPNLTLSNAIINSKYGGPWPNARYGFRITMSDGSTWTLKITLQGNIPASATATPTPKGGTSPVTGDTNNIVLYVVLLAVLVLALAVVLIIMVKRRGGRR